MAKPLEAHGFSGADLLENGFPSINLKTQKVMNIIQTQNDLLAFVKDQLTSDNNLSIRGVARLCGVDDMSILRNADFASKKLGLTLAASGFEAADLSVNEFPPKARWATN